MDLYKAMKCFLAVAEQGGFAAAGKSLGQSKSMVSKQLSALERHLGARLLYRTTRRLSLTETGRRYLSHCRAVVEQNSLIEEELAHEAGVPRGLLRVSAPLSYGNLVLGPEVGAFLADYPQVKLDLVLGDRFVDLIEEGFDLGLRIGGDLPSSLIARHLGWAAQGFYAAPSYLTQYGCPGSAAQLTEHNCLLYGQDGTSRPWIFQGDRISPDWALLCNNGDLLRQVAIDGAGLVALPEFFVKADLAAGRLVEVASGKGHYDRQEIRFVYPHRHFLPRKVRVFMDFMLERLKTSGTL
ncbi:MAG: LysR family transcriptional regulator [Kiloniellales bacterium]|nr:LysR family transcriptional regulator [Kiloniellales bacterium]